MTTMATTTAFFPVATDASNDDSSISLTDSFSEGANGNTIATDEGSYTFTPKRAKPLPRAWERKPATPFAPRNDAQKIWKRIQLPLSSLNFDSNHPNRKEKMLAEETMRVLKRIKMSVSGSVFGGDNDEDKENCIFAPTKLEFEQLWNWSPVKRKTFSAVDAKSLDVGMGAAIEEGNRLLSEDEDKASELPHEAGIDADETESETSNDEIDHRDGDDHTMTPPGFFRPDSEGTEPGDKTAISDIGSTPIASLVAEPLDEPNPIPEASQLESEITKKQLFMPIEAPVKPQVASDVPALEMTQGESGVDTETEVPAPINKSPLKHIQIATVTSTELNVVTGTESEPTLIIPDSCLDQDDTAFLHDFLKRARAQKAARVSLILQSGPTTSELLTENTPGGENETGCSRSPLAEFLSEDIIEPDPVDEDMETELKASSPCRRSSRMLTRLPRPQKPITPLPNSIALKRLNGSEFISMQQESQSLALVTRTNTKRNRGDAVPVKMKLIQLQFLLKDDALSQDATAVKESQILIKAGKLRKEVTWDKILARAQDGQKTLDFAGIEPDGTVVPEREGAEATAEKKDQTRKVRKIRKVNAGTVNGTPAPKRSLSLVFGSEVYEDTPTSLEHDGGRKLRTRVK